MGIVEAVADKIATGQFGTVGSTIFIGLMPDGPDAVVTVYESLGPGIVEHFGGGISLDHVTIQVSVRGTRDDYPNARDLANNIRKYLAGVTEETVGGVRILRMRPEGYINSIGRDDEDRPLFTMNFIATVAP
jgi:hypothetical protein